MEYSADPTLLNGIFGSLSIFVLLLGIPTIILMGIRRNIQPLRVRHLILVIPSVLSVIIYATGTAMDLTPVVTLPCAWKLVKGIPVVSVVSACVFRTLFLWANHERIARLQQKGIT
eukprot:762762_1